MTNFHIFHRTWWINNPEYPDGLEPGAGKKTTISYVNSIEEARDACEEWNDDYAREHASNRLSRKAEFESC